ncbi:hypothetical protein JOB18_036988 [Solea senegalensis]|uniref:Uncharacterized protein n=1 Tax=Solea senegalensis TaxID=28829 RepID=A0AAV6R6D0_SOLSE|nr:hypothetical protein JOB18_036988 [Solea senegalensis]
MSACLNPQSHAAQRGFLGSLSLSLSVEASLPSSCVSSILALSSSRCYCNDWTDGARDAEPPCEWAERAAGTVRGAESLRRKVCVTADVMFLLCERDRADDEKQSFIESTTNMTDDAVFCSTCSDEVCAQRVIVVPQGQHQQLL